MSQVFVFARWLFGGFAFQGFYRRDRGTRRYGIPTLLLNARESKNQTQYADNAPAMARTPNKISVPQERGRLTQTTLLPTRP